LALRPAWLRTSLTHASPRRWSIRSRILSASAGSWDRVERIIARVEAGPEGVDTRFITTSLAGGSPRAVYEKTYCRRGQMEI
jgi:hypothetical protein